MENGKKQDTSVRSKEKRRSSSENSPSRSKSQDSNKKKRSPSSSPEQRKKSFHSRDRRRRSRSAESSASAKNNGCSLYVSNLHSQLRESELEDKFSAIGKLLSSTIIRDPFTKESRGFGFVVFEKDEEAKEAIDKLHNSEFKGQNLRVEVSKRKKARRQTPGKYIGNNKPKGYGDRRYDGGGRYGRDRRDDRYSRDRDRRDDRYSRDRR